MFMILINMLGQSTPLALRRFLRILHTVAMGAFGDVIPRVMYLQAAAASPDGPRRVVNLAAVARLERFDSLGPGGEGDLPEALFAPGGLSTAFSGVGVASLDAVDASELTAVADVIERALGPAANSQPGRVHPSSSETVFEDGDAGLRIFSFLHRQAHLSRAEFSDLWRGFIDTFMAAGELRRHCSSYIQNHVPSDAETMFDGIAEMGFRTLADLLAFMSEPSLVQELFPAEAPFIDRTDGVAIMTRPAEVPVGDAARSAVRSR
jgi:EthD domain